MLKPILFTVTLLFSAVLLPVRGSPMSDVSSIASPAAISPTLGNAATYSVLAASTATNTGPTILPGDLGVSPGSAVTGFPPGIVNLPGAIHLTDAHAAAAQADNLIAFGALDQICTTTYAGTQDLTLVSPLVPGVYCAVGFALSGSLVLSGSSGVWIFKSSETVITSPNSSVTGGDPCNVWWRVGSSATLDTNTDFIGNILALTSITLNTGAALNGRALAQTGAVTMQSNTISSVCALPPTAVELLYFIAGRNGQSVVLDWATAEEVDNYGFMLYRAPVDDIRQATSIHFEPSVFVGGTGSGSTYRYLDTLPDLGKWWYWLVDVDMNGGQSDVNPSAAIDIKAQINLPWVGKH